MVGGVNICSMTSVPPLLPLPRSLPLPPTALAPLHTRAAPAVAQPHRCYPARPQHMANHCYGHAHAHAHILRQLSDNHCSITAIIVQSSSLASPSITVGSS